MAKHLLITMIIFLGYNVRNCRPIRTLIRIYFKGVRSFAELIPCLLLQVKEHKLIASTHCCAAFCPETHYHNFMKLLLF